ncbi:MAG: hypothetical protein ACK5KP_05350 [Paludibacteraceae bacterium]
MKPKIWFLTLLLITSFFGCDEYMNDVDYNDEYVLPVTKSVKTSDSWYFIRFDSVFTDSRCPQDVICVWEGVAGLRFTVSDIFQSSDTFELYTMNNPNLQMGDSTVFRNLKIKLVALQPHLSSNKQLSYSDYKAKIKVTKLN